MLASDVINVSSTDDPIVDFNKIAQRLDKMIPKDYVVSGNQVFYVGMLDRPDYFSFENYYSSAFAKSHPLPQALIVSLYDGIGPNLDFIEGAPLVKSLCFPSFNMEIHTFSVNVYLPPKSIPIPADLTCNAN